MVLRKNFKKHKTVFTYRTITFFGNPSHGFLLTILSKCSSSAVTPQQKAEELL
jgi:hypothetical protein